MNIKVDQDLKTVLETINSIAIIVLIFHLILVTSCNVEIPRLKELVLSENIEEEIGKLISSNSDILPLEYMLHPNFEVNYNDGVKEGFHSIYYSCYNDKLDKLVTEEIDSISYILAKVILNNVKNDTSFSRIAISMEKKNNGIITEKEWNYLNIFSIEELKIK